MEASSVTYPYPCKFWARGKCRQGDNCKFLHTPISTPEPVNVGFINPLPTRCRFFDSGVCLKGNACTYLHDVGPHVTMYPPFYPPVNLMDPGFYYHTPPFGIAAYPPHVDVAGQSFIDPQAVPVAGEAGQVPADYIDVDSTRELRALLGLSGQNDKDHQSSGGEIDNRTNS